MTLFACENESCLTVDNTSHVPMHAVRLSERRQGRRVRLECSVCLHGAWHGAFPRRRYDPVVDGPLGEGRELRAEVENRRAPVSEPGYLVRTPQSRALELSRYPAIRSMHE